MRVRAAATGFAEETTAAPLVEDAATKARASAEGETVDRTDLSRLGSLLHTLDELRQRDPSRYQRAVASLSRRLDEAAAARPGDQAELLEALARKFRQSGGAAAQPAAAGRAAAYTQASSGAPSALEDLVEASLKESEA